MAAPAKAVFDVPDDIGPLVWSAGWAEKVDLFPRILFPLLGSMFVGWGAASVGVPDTIIPAVITFAAVVGFFALGPPKHCHCVGASGFSISTARFGVPLRRRVVLFDAIDDVEVNYTRIVSDAVHALYARTQVSFRWLDRDGKEVWRLDGNLEEPSQRAAVRYDSTAPIDEDARPYAGASDPAALGLRALQAFHAFKDQRPRSAYR